MRIHMRIKNLRMTYLLIILIVLAIIPVVVVYNYFRNEEKTIRKNKENELTAISMLKADQLEHWVKDRRGDAGLFKDSPLFGVAIMELMKNPNDKAQREKMLKRISLTKKYYDYENIIVTDAKGNMIISAVAMPAKLSKATISKINEAVRLKDIYLTDFYFCDLCNHIHLDFIAPLKDKEDKIIATVIVRVNPDNYLFPMIQSLPIPSKTLETLLCQKEGDSVILCNDLRFRKNAAMNLSFSIMDTDVMSVKAVKGKTGIHEGKDYKGAKVVADLRRVEGTKWFLVTKIEREELFSELNYRKSIAIIILIIITILIAITLYSFYNTYNKRIYKKLYLQEKEINMMEKKFETTLYSIGDAVLITDKAGRISNLNPIAEILTGWKEDEAKGLSIEKVFNIINENNRESLENPVNLVLKEGGVVSLASNTLLISRDGKETPISDSAAPVRNDNGDTSGVVLVFRDQTEERKALKTLAESRRKFQKLFTSTNDGICLHELVYDGSGNHCDYKILDLNDKYIEMTGIIRDKAIGASAIELYGINEAPYLDIYSRVAISGKPVMFETYFAPMKKHFNISVFSPEENQFATAFQDITSRKQSEENLKESEEKFSKMGNSALDAVILINDKGNIEFWNPAAEKMFGYLKAEIYDKNLHSLIAPEKYIEAHIKGWDKFYKTGLGFAIGKVVELTGKRKTGEEFPIELALSTIELKNSYWALGYIRDISERKLAEDEIKLKNVELQKLNTEKDRFFSIIAHDLRGPLSGLMMATEMMVKEEENITPELKKRMTINLSQSTRNIFNLLENLLEWSQIQQGLLGFNPKKLALNEIISECKNLVAEAAGNKGIEITVDIPKDMKVIADTNMLKTIFRNLITNAIKFTPQGGKITLSAVNTENNMLAISVRDTGIGMNNKMLENLFRIDTKSSRPGTSGEHGTGLGLLLCKEFVEKHN